MSLIEKYNNNFKPLDNANHNKISIVEFNSQERAPEIGMDSNDLLDDISKKLSEKITGMSFTHGELQSLLYQRIESDNYDAIISTIHLNTHHAPDDIFSNNGFSTRTGVRQDFLTIEIDVTSPFEGNFLVEVSI